MDIGIDLGTANIIITVGNKGVVLDEPSVVAYNKRTHQVIEVGEAAYRMIGRTPEYIVAIRPLKNGVISDSDMTQSMIHDFLRKVCGNFLFKPRVIICVPSFITDVESRAVFEAARSAGARKVYLIQEPIAALLGTGKDISEPRGNMIVDIGGGTTDVAVISMNGIVAAKSIRIAGNKFDEALIKYINNKHKISIGEKTAEQAKMQIANVYDAIGKKKMVVRGRHLIEGLPSQVEITDIEVARALKPVVSEIVAAIRSVMEQTPPELVGDIHDTGIILTGGGALLNGLDRYIEREINAPCNIAENPIECVVRGTSIAFNKISELRDGFEMISQYKYK